LAEGMEYVAVLASNGAVKWPYFIMYRELF